MSMRRLLKGANDGVIRPGYEEAGIFDTREKLGVRRHVCVLAAVVGKIGVEEDGYSQGT